MPVRLALALHNHQPVGNFPHVLDDVYQKCYKPFLDTLERFPRVPLTLHVSGSLLDWLVEKQPAYLERLQRLIGRGQVEILGGAYYEPILPMIPSWDRLGQIRLYKEHLEKVFQVPVRGMWLPERVWEKSLVGPIVAAGLDYTILDDFHFAQAGVEEKNLFGYHLTEDDGRLLRLFPANGRLRALIPVQEPEKCLEYLSAVHERYPEAVIVLADDGEKLGSWPGTHDHCYRGGWLSRFLELLTRAPGWLQLRTLSQVLEEKQPVARTYLPDNSYRKMGLWALPPQRQAALEQTAHGLAKQGRGAEINRHLRVGCWHNFKGRYPETGEMYARMMQVSQRLQEAGPDLPADLRDQALRSLYRGQCNCAYWHGIFGGIYLPDLRHAVYQNLLAAENLVLRHQRQGAWSEPLIDDLNLDGAQEVCLNNHRLAAYFEPHQGGRLYELDLRVLRHNLLATLSRRPESYHAIVRWKAQNPAARPANQGPHLLGDPLVAVQPAGLERQILQDTYLRKALIDHFYEPHVTVEELAMVREVELGDFVQGIYDYHVTYNAQELVLTMSRQGKVGLNSVRVTKEIRLSQDRDALAIRYALENLPPGSKPLHFAVEFNFSGLPAPAFGSYFSFDDDPYAGDLNEIKELDDQDHIGLVDEWRGIKVWLHSSRRGGIWAFPVQTVNQSDAGFELVHQGTAVMPHWHVEPDEQGRWEVQLDLALDSSLATQKRAGRA